MTVHFNNIPGNIRVPFFHVEFQPGGTPYSSIARLNLKGQMFTEGDNKGTALPNFPVLVRNGEEGVLFGRGSMLEQMVLHARKAAPLQEIWATPLADGTSTKSSGKITINTTVDAASIATLYIAGKRIRQKVLPSYTKDNIAANLVALINSDPSLYVTAAVNSINNNEVDLEATFGGLLSNKISIDVVILGDESTTGREIYSITPMSGGSGGPEIATSFDAYGDNEFDWIGSPYADPINLEAAHDYLNDVSGAWSYVNPLYGHYLTSLAEPVANLSSIGNGLNDQHISIMPSYGSATPPWIWAAVFAAVAARDLQAPPLLSAPLHVELPNVLPPMDTLKRLTMADRQLLYYDGISGYRVTRDNRVYVDRAITTYQSNQWGDLDATYLDLETMAQSMYGIRYLKQKATNEHGRKSLASSNPFNVETIATPEDVRNTIIHGYRELVGLGVFEDVEQFARELRVERAANDANRLDMSMPLDHVNQLRIMAAAAVNHMQRSTVEA